MRPTPPDFDPVVRSALDEAKALLAAGRIPAALALYQRTWDTLIAKSDHFHASVVAHMAGVAGPDPAKKHEWNIAALREADAVPDLMRARGMYSSLYNNLGMSNSMIGDRDKAQRCFEQAKAHLEEIDPGPYADAVRSGIERNLERLRS